MFLLSRHLSKQFIQHTFIKREKPGKNLVKSLPSKNSRFKTRIRNPIGVMFNSRFLIANRVAYTSFKTTILAWQQACHIDTRQIPTNIFFFVHNLVLLQKKFYKLSKTIIGLGQLFFTIFCSTFL